MEEGFKRFTISLTPDIEAELRVVRRTYFVRFTQNEMIKELIRRGIEAVAADGRVKELNGKDNNLREG